MESPIVNRTFCSETLRCMYHIFGYETLMKEIQFIHRLYTEGTSSNTVHTPSVSSCQDTSNNASSTDHTINDVPLSTSRIPRPVPVKDSIPSVIVHKVQEQKEDDGDKNSNVSPQRIKYTRSQKPDDAVCSAVTGQGVRCTLSRKDSTLFCSRHLKIHQKETSDS